MLPSGCNRPPGLRLLLAATALLVFLCLAGAQPQVMWAVLMAAMALLIPKSRHHSRPLGVLGLTPSAMLLLCPTCALSIGFQLSAVPTAGLILTAPPLEQAVQVWLPDRCQGLAAALSIPVAKDILAFWQALAYRVEAPQQGRSHIAIGQVLWSDGLSVQRLQQR